MPLLDLLLGMTAAVHFILGVVVFLKGWPKKAARVFSLLLFTVAFWLLGYLGAHLFGSILFAWSIPLFSLLMVAAFLHFSLIFPKENKLKPGLLLLIYGPALALSLFPHKMILKFWVLPAGFHTL